MDKVSVGLRGWRFTESEIFDEDGEFKPLDEIPEEPRERLVRLRTLVEEPCDACYLTYGEAEIERCRQATIVYGEPFDEVLLCADHEQDFRYWFQEAGGSEFTGDEEFANRFHEWFDAGNRAPDGFGGIEHVDADPDALPDPPDPIEIQKRLEQDFEGKRIDLREYLDDVEEPDEEERVDEADLEEADLDLSTNYPDR